MYRYRCAPESKSSCLFFRHTCRVFAEHRFRVDDRGILSRTHARWSEIPPVGTWSVRERRHDIRRRAARARDLPQTSHS